MAIANFRYVVQSDVEIFGSRPEDTQAAGVGLVRSSLASHGWDIMRYVLFSFLLP